MLATLASADAVTWLSIAIKALAYATTLNAIGAVLVLSALRELSESGRASLRKTAVLSAILAAIFTATRLPLRASFLMGGAFDPVILGMVTDSPLGTSAALRLAGLALVVCVIWRSSFGNLLALFGAILASTSFAVRGHALAEPQMILGALVTGHILCLAFWVAALGPLLRSAKIDPALHSGALAHEFGRKALWVVGGLVLTGGVTLTVLGAAEPSALSSAYGQMFAIKLVVFAGVLLLAATNKLAFTPALLNSAPGASAHLRRSIRVEAALIAAILVATATLTTLSSPPARSEANQTTLNLPATWQAQQTMGDAL